MAMNREQKRMMQKRGLAGADGTPVSGTRDRRTAAPRVRESRTPIKQLIGEIIAELKKCTKPTRAETFRLAGIVLIAIVVLTLFIFGLDYAFSSFAGFFYKTTPDSAAALTAFLI